eukprot:TRINITY_DN5021_c0_g1_i1.p1 TRINITY_DN5021_c0_g1~~TRINITY_DN5021_c0_g1_i1.p1  ORF type:complete len:610 (-),score=148.17 TRINITY_DN5021_c0_g1_i1:34-1863(-)
MLRGFGPEASKSLNSSGAPGQLFVIAHGSFIVLLTSDFNLQVSPVNDVLLPSTVGAKLFTCNPPIKPPSAGALDTPPSTSPLLKINSDCTKLACYWDRTCYVIDLPPLSVFEDVDSYNVPAELSASKIPLIFPIIQLEWHPLSPKHLCILNSKRLDVYNLALKSKHWEAWYEAPGFVSFCFGSVNAPSWTRFSIIFIDRFGKISLLCPIIPYGVVLSKQQFQELRKLSKFIQASKIDNSHVESILNAFVENKESQQMVYVPKENVRNVAMQSVVANVSKTPLPSGTLALQVASLPHEFPFLHVIRLYNSGHLDVLVGFHPVEPRWQASQLNLDVSVINLRRNLIANWKADSFSQIVLHSNEHGVLIRAGCNLYSAELLGFDFLKKIVDSGATLGTALNDDSKDSPAEKLRAIMNGVWHSDLVSDDALNGVAFSVLGFERTVVQVNSRFEFFYVYAKELKGLRGEQEIIVPGAVRVSTENEFSEVKESPVPDNFQTLATRLRTLRGDAEKITNQTEFDTLNGQFGELVDELYAIGSSEEMQTLQQAQREIMSLGSRVERLEGLVKQSSKYSHDDVALSSFLKDLQNSVPEYQQSLIIVISSLFLNFVSRC